MLNATMSSFNPSACTRQSDLILFAEHFTKRGERTLSHNGFKFSMHQQSRINPDVQFWRCTVRRPMHCKGRIEVQAGTAFGRITNGYHWHPPYYSRAVEKKEDRERGRHNAGQGEFSSAPADGSLLDDSNDPDIVLLEDSTPPPIASNFMMNSAAPMAPQAHSRATFNLAPAQSRVYYPTQSTSFQSSNSNGAAPMWQKGVANDGLQRNLREEQLYVKLERLFVDHRCLLCDERIVHRASRVRHFETYHSAELRRMERRSPAVPATNSTAGVGGSGSVNSSGVTRASSYPDAQAELRKRKRPKSHTSLCDYFETLPGGDGRDLRCRLCGVVKARGEVTGSSLWQHLLLVHGIVNPYGSHARPPLRHGGGGGGEGSHHSTPASSSSHPQPSTLQGMLGGDGVAPDFCHSMEDADGRGDDGDGDGGGVDEKRSRMDEEIEFNTPAADANYSCSSLTDLLLRSTVMQQQRHEEPGEPHIDLFSGADLLPPHNPSSASVGENALVGADSLLGDRGEMHHRRCGGGKHGKRDATPGLLPVVSIKAEQQEEEEDLACATSRRSYVSDSVVQVTVAESSSPSCSSQSAPPLGRQNGRNGASLAAAMAALGEDAVNGAVTNGGTARKRLDYINWDEFFMGTALLAAQRSKDPCTQVGAVIANEENVIVSIGYNGMPIGCSDDELPWGKGAADPLSNKYLYVCHAEMNAVLNRNSGSLRNATIYCTMFPCNECAKLIIQSRIKRVVYLADKPNKVEMLASRRLFAMAAVEYSQFIPKRSRISLDFEPHGQQ